MTRLRRCCALATFLAPLLLPGTARGDQPPAEKWLIDRTVEVTPAAAPVPALRYRLFPSEMERKEGNAVPMYLRFAHERSDARKKELREKPEAWNKLAIEKLPLAEVKAFLKGYEYNLNQMDLAARRKTADWNYSLDVQDIIGLLLPDVQEMRMHAPVLILKARAEMAEGRYAEAVRTLETGFSFSRQVGEAPFLISSLVGIAIASQISDCLLELAQRPDAPNLYWALAVVPRPLIGLRWGYEFEENMLELQFPDLADMNRPRTAGEWEASLRRVRQELVRLSRNDRDVKPLPVGTGPDDPADKSPDLPAARKYLAEVARMKADRIEAMSAAEVLMRYQSAIYHELRDETFKPTYLPLHQALPLLSGADARLKAAPKTQAAQLTVMFLAAVWKVEFAQARIERRLALLQAIEALRQHAAANGGRLPSKLDEVKGAPVPDDPGTGKPFEYQLDGATATLVSRIPGEPLETSGIRYRITVRK